MASAIRVLPREEDELGIRANSSRASWRVTGRNDEVAAVIV